MWGAVPPEQQVQGAWTQGAEVLVEDQVYEAVGVWTLFQAMMEALQDQSSVFCEPEWARL